MTINYAAKITGKSAYSPGKYYSKEEVPMKEGELHAEYEMRTFMNRLHVDKKTGEVFIPPMAFKNALASAAKYLSKSIKGQGKKTYTAKIESGVLCFEPFMLGVTQDGFSPNELFLPSDGKRGGGKRVTKVFPVILNWGGTLHISVVDPIVSKDVLREHLEAAGNYIGVGTFRPQNNGYYGRFVVDSIKKIA